MKNTKKMVYLMIVACVLLGGLLVFAGCPSDSGPNNEKPNVEPVDDHWLGWDWEVTDDSNERKFAAGHSTLFGYVLHTPENGFDELKYSQIYDLDPYDRLNPNPADGWYRKYTLAESMQLTGTDVLAGTVKWIDAHGYDDTLLWPNNKGKGDLIIKKVPALEKTIGPDGVTEVDAFHFQGLLFQKGCESEDESTWVQRTGVRDGINNLLKPSDPDTDYRRSCGWPTISWFMKPPFGDTARKYEFFDGYGYTFWVKSEVDYTAYRTAVENSEYRAYEAFEPGHWYGTSTGRDATAGINFTRAPVGEWTKVTVIYDPKNPKWNMEINNWIMMYGVQTANNYPGDREPVEIEQNHDKDNSIRISWQIQLQHNGGNEGTENVEYSCNNGRHPYNIWFYGLEILQYE